jgi:hypothetical protein
MKSFLRAKDLNTRSYALEGSEIFGSSKRKLDLPSRLFDSHRLKKVNYSIPHSITRSTKAFIEDFLKPVGHGIAHITYVYKTDCNLFQWYIAHLPPISKRQYQALQANTRHSCNARIAKGFHRAPTPTYTRLKKEYRL